MSKLLDKLKSAQRARGETGKLFDALRRAQAGRDAERAQAREHGGATAAAPAPAEVAAEREAERQALEHVTREDELAQEARGRAASHAEAARAAQARID